MELKVGSLYTSMVKAEVVDEADVLVCGGGTGGPCAAIAAARNGASVILVESRGFLGGMMTEGNAGLTRYIVHVKDSDDKRKVVAQLATEPSSVQIVGGIPLEITHRLMEIGAAIGTNGTAGNYVFTAQQDFKWFLLKMMEEAGVKLLLHSMVVDVIKDGDDISGIIVENKSGRQVVLGKVIVDATGDGDVAAKAGAPFVLGVGPDDLAAEDGTPLGTMQNMGVMFRMGNVDLAKCLEYLKDHPDQFHLQGLAKMDFDEVCDSVEKGEMATFVVRGKGFGYQIYNTPIPGVVVLCCPSFGGDGTSVRDQVQGEIVVTKLIHKGVSALKESIQGFEDAYVLDCPEIWTRESRHIQGEYVLNIEDIFSGREFEDGIGKGSHTIDISPIPESLRKYKLPNLWAFNIPYRCLVAKGVNNLLLAGRCISNTHEASGCTRPTVQCMITGEAAGAAAAMCATEGVKPRDLDAGKLRSKLAEQGVVL